MSPIQRLLFLCWLVPLSSNAISWAGETLTADYTGFGTEYYIKYTMYRNCQGIPASQSVVVHYTLNNQYLGQINLNQYAGSSLQDSICVAPYVYNCPWMGFEIVDYVDTISLQTPGNYRFFVLTPSGFSTSYILSQGAIYTEAAINVQTGIIDRLPEFNPVPEFYFCINSPVIYNSYATDPDGDSLVYTLASIKLWDSTSVSNPVNAVYNIPFDSVNFVASTITPNLNAQTGQLTFNPSNQQYGLLSIKADSYRNGLYLGSVTRNTAVFILNVASVDENNPSALFIFPTLATDILYVNHAEYEYQIYDLSGKKIICKEDKTGSIDVSALKKGMYLVSFINESDIKTFRFIKN